jgi:hypothetical protein
LRASATRSKVLETKVGAAEYLEPGAEFDWPFAPRLDGGIADLRRVTGATLLIRRPIHHPSSYGALLEHDYHQRRRRNPSPPRSSNPELLPNIRASYGLAGIVYEATFKLKPIAIINFNYNIHVECLKDSIVKKTIGGRGSVTGCGRSIPIAAWSTSSSRSCCRRRESRFSSRRSATHL